MPFFACFLIIFFHPSKLERKKKGGGGGQSFPYSILKNHLPKGKQRTVLQLQAHRPVATLPEASLPQYKLGA